MAHTATVEWLGTRLAEVASGGPAALRPTPPQVVAGVARQLVSLPTRRSAEAVNRSFAAIEDLTRRTQEGTSTNIDRARQLVGAVEEIWTAGRDATLGRTEEVAKEHEAKGTVTAVRRTRRSLGALSADELPVRSYDSLNAGTAISRMGRLRSATDVGTVLAYERANKNRKGVVAAAEARLQDLAGKMAAAS